MVKDRRDAEQSLVSRLRDPTTDLLSADDVLNRLIDRPWLRKAALSCVLPAVRMDGRWWYRRRDLDNWIASQKEGPLP
jgi:hypothetical protein